MLKRILISTNLFLISVIIYLLWTNDNHGKMLADEGSAPIAGILYTDAYSLTDLGYLRLASAVENQLISILNLKPKAD